MGVSGEGRRRRRGEAVLGVGAGRSGRMKRA